ncbi:unnamed protein product [Tenebrio molitor]|nr:unnamed protein product [Tenebrio molitor]
MLHNRLEVYFSGFNQICYVLKTDCSPVTLSIWSQLLSVVVVSTI